MWNVFRIDKRVTADITALEEGEGIRLVTDFERALREGPTEQVVIRVAYGESDPLRMKLRTSLENIAEDHALDVWIQVQG